MAVTAPLKSIATRLGLGRYGRNNVTYAEGLGSYLQLCGYTTDADVAPAWASDHTAPVQLEQCTECERYIAACPTRAIGRDRFLVKAHRCLTFANENPGEWPEWVPRHAHNCLMGCLACQRSCPANPPLRIVDSGVCFTREETRALLTSPDDAPNSVRQGIQSKLQKLDHESGAPLFGRNLKALLHKRSVRAWHPLRSSG